MIKIQNLKQIYGFRHSGLKAEVFCKSTLSIILEHITYKLYGLPALHDHEKCYNLYILYIYREFYCRFLNRFSKQCLTQLSMYCLVPLTSIVSALLFLHVLTNLRMNKKVL